MKNWLPWVIIFIACYPYITLAQTLRQNIGIPYIAMSAYTTKQVDVFSFTGNQAALAQVKEAGIAVFGERRYMLAQIANYGLAGVLPTTLGNFGIQVNKAGFANFSEQKVGLAYARSLGSKVDVGVQFNYYGYNIPTYSAAGTINFEAGAILHISDKLNAGLHVYNPVSASIGKLEAEKLAAAYKLGFGYDASDNFFVSAEIVKEEDVPVNVTGAVQYQFEKQFFVRAGFKSDNKTGFAGAGFVYKKLRTDISASFHPQLGVSPGLLLMYNFNKKEK